MNLKTKKVVYTNRKLEKYYKKILLAHENKEKKKIFRISPQVFAINTSHGFSLKKLLNKNAATTVFTKYLPTVRSTHDVNLLRRVNFSIFLHKSHEPTKLHL